MKENSTWYPTVDAYGGDSLPANVISDDEISAAKRGNHTQRDERVQGTLIKQESNASRPLNPLYGLPEAITDVPGPTDNWAQPRSNFGKIESTREEIVSQVIPRTWPLPTSNEARKALPIFTGLLMYFPNACLAVSEVSRVGNDQHNPGQPLHWARGKSTDQLNTAVRHIMDHGMGVVTDTDGTYHLAKAAWRILAELQLTIEQESR